MIFYPSEGTLVMEERRVQREAEITMAEEIVAEFLKEPLNRAASIIPRGAKVLGLYQGSDGILYIDLSDEFRKNFQGDALAEFLLLKGLYESIISNVKGVNDVKVVIEGQEMESIGGHLFALYPLKNTLAEAK
ncbi:MAG: GerMN domain-containing protein [Thermodesulfovibrionales bacterium]